MRIAGRMFGLGLLILVVGFSSARAQSSTQTDKDGYYDVAGRLNTWTTDDVYRRRLDGDYEFLTMRFGKHAGFDRVVFEFKGNQGKLYGLFVTYEKPPFQAEDNEKIVKVHGRAFVKIELYPIGSSDENVEANNRIAMQQNKVNMPLIREVKPVEWFEGELTYVFGLKRPTPFRVQVFSNPTRLVVDFKH
jgi:hypothetical protein